MSNLSDSMTTKLTNAGRVQACAESLAVIDRAPSGRPFVVAQLGQSLDGRIATRTGESRWINGGVALDHVHRLRAHVDAVLVGIGTVLADDPLLTVRRVAGAHPARVIIDLRGRLPANSRCLMDDGIRRIIIRSQDSEACGEVLPDGVEVLRIEMPVGEKTSEMICPRAIARALYDRGLKRILVEGGAKTVSQFIEAGALDRLHVLVAPVILGSGKTGLDLKPIDVLEDARRPDTRAYILDDGEVVFDCQLK